MFCAVGRVTFDGLDIYRAVLCVMIVIG